MSSEASKSALVLELAEEFLQRHRQGERPSLQEYTDRHPELAAEICEVFPAMAMMENIALADESLAKPPSAEAEAREILPLQQLGDYRIIRQVGHGGMGIVYEAEQISLGRHVALKVLPQKLLLDPKYKRRFEREAKAAAKLHHTNIVPVFGVGEHDGLPYYAMQFIQGLGLDEVLDELQRLQPGAAAGGELGVSARAASAAQVARSLLTGNFEPAGPDGGAADPGREPEAGATVDQPAGPVDEPAPATGTGRLSDSLSLSSSSLVLPGQGEAARKRAKKATYWQSIATIGVQVAEALDYAHRQGVVHRDIKPSNLLLDLRGTVWVTDFGLAKAADQPNLTHTGDILGTLRYLPPEAFEGRTDARGDVYSLGLTLYELLALRPAFPEQDRHRLIKQVTTTEPPRLEKLNPAIPRDLVTVVHKAIDRDPGHRYPSAVELAADLQRFLDDEPIKARRTTLVERARRWCRRNPAVASLTAVVQAALLVILGLSLWSSWRIGRALDEKEAERARAVAAEKDAVAETARALGSETKALRQGRPSGWRDTAFANLRRLRELDTPQKDPVELRDEAVACLAEPDLRLILRIRGHGDSVYSLDFSPDGKTLASAGYDGKVYVWDVADGRMVEAAHFPAARQGRAISQGYRPAVRFRPDGRCLAYATGQRSVRLLGLGNAPPPFSQIESQTSPRSLAFNQKGNLLAVSWSDGQVGVYDAATGAPRRPLIATGVDDPQLPNRPLAVSPDGTWLATIGPSHAVMRHALDGEKAPEVIGRHRGPIHGLCFSPDGASLASASADRTVKVWDVATGKELRTFQGHSSSVNGVAFSPDGDLAATVSEDRSLRLWDARTGQPLQVLYPGFLNLLAVAFNRDGTRLAVSGSWRGGLFEVRRPGARQRLAGHGDPEDPSSVYGLAFHPRHPVLAFGGTEGKISLWDTDSGRPHPRRKGRLKDAISSLAFSPDGEQLAVIGTDFDEPFPSGDQAVYVLDARTGEERRRLPWQWPAGDSVRWFHGEGIAFDPSGRRLAAAASDLKRLGLRSPGSVLVWDVPSGRLLHQFHFDRRVHRVAFLNQGAWLALNQSQFRGQGEGGRILIVDLVSGKPIREAIVPGARRHFAISPDESELVVPIERVSAPDGGATGDHALQVLRLPDLELTASLETVHESWIQVAAYSPDGQLLATAGSDRRVVLWDRNTWRQLVTLPLQESTIYRLAFDPTGTHLAASGTGEGITLWDLRLVRRGLDELNLDWDHPPLPGQRGGRPLTTSPQDELWRRRLEADQLVGRAWQHHRNAQDREARALFRRALELDPHSGGAHNDAAWFLLIASAEVRDPVAALPLARKAVELEPKDNSCHNTLGVALYYNGRYDEAVASLERALQLKSATDPVPYDLFILAMCHARLGNPAKARDCYDQAVQWLAEQGDLQPRVWLEGMKKFQAEAEAVLRQP
jgi:WD40 repeat protein/serine/threonine protein kinase/Tfp pilus assembly protein PilF